MWSREYILLVKSGKDSGPGPGPGPNCQQQVADAIRTEKETCSSSTAELREQHLRATGYCEDKNEKLKDQIREMFTRPKRDWSLLPADMKHVDEVRSVAFSPDGKIMASADSLGEIKFWDMENNGSLHQWKDDEAEISSIAFSPDGKQLLAADAYTGKIFLLDVSMPRKIVEFAGHALDTYSVAFAPDGNRFASGSADKSVRFWDIKTQSSKELKGHTDKVSSFAFSSNGKYLCFWVIR